MMPGCELFLCAVPENLDHCIYHPEWKVAIHTEPINAHDYCGEKLAYLYKGEVLLPSKVFPESRSEGCYPATNR